MQRINDKLKSLCKFCSSHLDKPCAWISLGNEYCDKIMDIQNELNNRIPRKDIEDLKEKIHWELDKNGITRGYQIIIDGYFNKLLNKEQIYMEEDTKPIKKGKIDYVFEEDGKLYVVFKEDEEE